MEKIKTYAKYTTNVLAIINALLLVIIPIWELPSIFNRISDTIIGVIGVIGIYLLGGKVVPKKETK